MVPDESWATPEDFASLFQYFWYRDFPIDPVSTGAKGTDWTIHIGVAVRKIADLMGFVARFESGGRTDAVLRSTAGDEFAIEWEWGGVWGNELEKLKTPRKALKKEPKCRVLITYTHTENISTVYQHVANLWKEAQSPLLLILIDLEESGDFTSGKKFKNMQMSMFRDGNPRQELRVTSAFPWEVEGTRWTRQKR